MRVCSQCRSVDREILIPGAAAEHWVVPELRWLPAGGAMTRREAAAGWAQRMVQGKPAIERLTCRECLNLNAVRDGVWAAMRADARGLEQKTVDRYYLSLCEE